MSSFVLSALFSACLSGEGDAEVPFLLPSMAHLPAMLEDVRPRTSPVLSWSVMQGEVRPILRRGLWSALLVTPMCPVCPHSLAPKEPAFDQPASRTLILWDIRGAEKLSDPSGAALGIHNLGEQENNQLSALEPARSTSAS